MGGARRNSGRKIIPLEIKKMKGTFRKDREKAAPDTSENKPIPPARLSTRAKQIFRNMVHRLSELGLASRSFTEMLALLCSRMAELENLDSILAEKGSTYETTNSQGETVVKQRPEVKLREQGMKHVHSLLAEFGLSPSAISRVPAVKKEKAEPNPFSQF